MANPTPEIEVPSNPEIASAETDSKVEKRDLSAEINQLDNRLAEAQNQPQEIAKEIRNILSEIKRLREELGLPGDEKNPPSVDSLTESLESNQREQEKLQKEREKLIEETVKKVIKDLIKELLKQSEALSPEAWSKVSNTGRNPDGSSVGAEGIMAVQPEDVKLLAEMINNGLKDVDKILEMVLPELMDSIKEEVEKNLGSELKEKEPEMPLSEEPPAPEATSIPQE